MSSRKDVAEREFNKEFVRISVVVEKFELFMLLLLKLNFGRISTNNLPFCFDISRATLKRSSFPREFVPPSVRISLVVPENEVLEKRLLSFFAVCL